ncbi:MAG TPA: glycosyltransferase [Methylomirabilota bacterium]|jgi:glycosyltransferase involved in cell wall biosynthesis|nr:glycosyltransferase [Methylomirabilota bacterium]
MDILVLAPYPPYPARFGGATRIFHLIRVLARDHRVTLLCFASPDQRAALGPLWELCSGVHTVDYPVAARQKRLYQLRSLAGRAYSYYAYYSPPMARALHALLARQRFDIVQLEFGDAGGYYEVPGTVLTVLDEHNVEHRILERTWQQETSPIRRLYNRVEAQKLRRDELAACRRADGILTTSDVDRATLATHVSGIPIRVIPNGVDTTFFVPPPPGTEDPKRIVFTGAINYQPNTDGVLHFCEEILPRIHAVAPEVTFAVVGKDPPERVRALAGPRVEVTGTVPDVRPWMCRAGMFVVPLRVGGGTRLKILEAMASGRAVISTSLGCEGLEVTHGDDIMIADTPADFADAVLRCLRDPGLRARLGARGRVLAERRYRWEVIGDELSAFYQDLQDTAVRAISRQNGRPRRRFAA